MGLILCLETATKTCSVSLSLNGTEIRTITEVSDHYSHSEKLNGFIEAVFEKTEFQLSDLDAIALSEGPGSYTGLRIGTSSAKGLCYALDIPLIAINSLEALAVSKVNQGTLICPLFDARRMEVYSSVFEPDLTILEETKAVVIDAESYAAFLAERKVVFIGPGAAKCQAIITHPNAIFDLDIEVSAAGMMHLAEAKFNDKNVVNLAYFEPFYLKDFIAGPPKKLF